MSQTKATHPEFVEIDLATVHEKMRTILAPAVAGLIVIGLAIWTYLPTLHLFVYRWTTEPDYVHGYLVIPFAAVLLWSRRETLLASPTWRAAATPSWWGLLPLAAWAVLVWLAAWFSSEQLIGLSLVPLLWGIALLAGGWDVLRWSWSAAAFLVFMIPLPRPAADWLSEPLRQVATSSSVFIIQTLGLAAHADGTRITLPDGRAEPEAGECPAGVLRVPRAADEDPVRIARRGE